MRRINEEPKHEKKQRRRLPLGNERRIDPALHELVKFASVRGDRSLQLGPQGL